MASTLRVGILGAGGIARQHAIGWQRSAPRAEIAAVADVSLPRAQAIADEFTGGRARIYDGIASLVADPDVDAVDICLPHHLHTEAIISAARAGKAILCEKPLCTSLEDARTIADTLRQTGVPFVMAHNQLFQPSLIEARRLLAMGVLGRRFVIRSIETFQHGETAGRPSSLALPPGESPWAWRSDLARMGGGEVLDTGWHASYRLLALADDRPTEVVAMTDRFFVPGLPAEDTGLLMVRFASGAIGHIITSWAFDTVGGWHFEVMGERGALAGDETRLLHQLYGWQEGAIQPFDPVHTFSAEIAHFLDVVQRGVPNLATFESAARVLQLTMGAYRSVAEGRVMHLPEDPLAAPEPVERVRAASATAAGGA